MSNIDGLSSLTNVGGNLDIKNNDKLTNIDGLSSLADVGLDVHISRNNILAKSISSLNTILLETQKY